MKKVVVLSLLTLFAVSVMAQDAKYEFKTAIIKMESSFGGTKSPSTVYIDDFGKKEARESVRNDRDGNASNMLNITDGTTTTSVNLTAKTATKMELRQGQGGQGQGQGGQGQGGARQGQGSQGQSINYLKLTPEIKAARNIKELGEETVAGKPCKKYSLETSFGERTSKITNWVWKGFVLKSETRNDNGEVTMSSVATEIQENATVPASKFVVPSGITVTTREARGR